VVLWAVRLVCAAVRVLRAHGCLFALCCRSRCSGELGVGGAEEMLSFGLSYLSPWQSSDVVDEARPPRREARFSGCPGTVMRVCADASPVQRDRRSCFCSLRRTTSWWRSSGGRRVCC
jgi:hypothetical protein